MSQASEISPVVSASRRCDIPSFYPRWFASRLRAGFALAANPFNPAQVSRIDLSPDKAKVFVFWTRNALPLMPFLGELAARGQGFYFLHTLLDSPRELEPHSPRPPRAVEGFRRLADKVGPDKVIWRYDPIVLSAKTGVDFHLRAFKRLARSLAGATRRVTVSLMTPYRKTAGRLAALAGAGLAPYAPGEDELSRLMTGLSGLARGFGLEITACAPGTDLGRFGLSPGACVDPVLIRRLFGLNVAPGKDKGQRPGCGCAKSRDIGAYDACLFGCLYCYATTSFTRARANHRAHDPGAPCLAALPPSPVRDPPPADS
ncbi:MAG: DUF1848 domain-containing protein [Desulfovibrionaceae bacterium]|nr:DUF1848 domain-containing protein [Desulfovibrionaceae bacterium]MBF0513119.1 DUF1848 domain-containing protein [Desulfovibrionaceae bacterium]